MKSIGNFLLRWWPSALVVAVILWLTLAPDPVGDPELELFPGADKLIHAIMMGGLASALMFDYRRNRGVKPYRAFTPRVMSLIFVSVVIFSALDEWAQGMMNMGRSADPLDFLADIIGIVIAMLLARPVLNRMFP